MAIVLCFSKVKWQDKTRFSSQENNKTKHKNKDKDRFSAHDKNKDKDRFSAQDKNKTKNRNKDK